MMLNQLLKTNTILFLPLWVLFHLMGVNDQKAVAQIIIPIGVSPMDQTPNDDSFNISPDFSPRNNPNNIPPLPSRTPARDTITIQGNSTPRPLPNVNGSTINSSQNLPSPPALSEPYRPPANVVNNNGSPYNQTPSNNNNIPTASGSNNTPPANTTANPPSETTVTQPSVPRRRTLREILVFDTVTSYPSSPPVTNPNPPSSTVAANGTRFRVVVRINDAGDQTRVREIYPDAFRSTHQGNSVLQVGVFSTRQNAEQAAQTLKNAGLSPILTQVN